MRYQVHEINYCSVQLAKEVAGKDHYIAGFVSSTNPDFLEPYGNLTKQEVYDGYKEQISALLEGQVDVIMVIGNQAKVIAIAVKVAKNL